MSVKRSRKSVLFAVVAILLLSLPLAVSAQTTTTQSSGAKTAAAPTNGITSPKEDAVLSGTVEVRGYANDPNFMKWQLDLLPNRDANAAIFLAVGDTPGEFTYAFNTAKLPVGEHALRLRVVRNDSNYNEYFTNFMIGKESTAEAKAGKSEETAEGATTASTATSTTTKATTATTTKATTAKPAATTTSKVGVSENGFAQPRSGEAISGNFEVRGYANDPNFMKWQLDLLPAGDQNAPIFLALGEAPGVFTYTLSTKNLPAGEHALRLRVVRNDSNYNEYLTKFVIGKAAATAAETAAAESKASAATQAKEGETTTATKTGTTATATATTESKEKETAAAQAKETAAAKPGAGTTTNGLSAPKEGETIRGPFVVKGYANNADFMKWQLDLLPGGDQNAPIFLAVGETPGQFSYTLDTTNFPAGKHALRLRVVRNDSNYDEYITNFTLAK